MDANATRDSCLACTQGDCTQGDHSGSVWAKHSLGGCQRSKEVQFRPAISTLLGLIHTTHVNMSTDTSIDRVSLDIADQSAFGPSGPVEPTSTSPWCMRFIVDCARSLPQRRSHRSLSQKQQSGRGPAESSITSCTPAHGIPSTQYHLCPSLRNLESGNEWP